MSCLLAPNSGPISLGPDAPLVPKQTLTLGPAMPEPTVPTWTLAECAPFAPPQAGDLSARAAKSRRTPPHGSQRHAQRSQKGLATRQIQYSRLEQRLSRIPPRTILKCDCPDLVSNNHREGVEIGFLSNCAELVGGNVVLGRGWRPAEERDRSGSEYTGQKSCDHTFTSLALAVGPRFWQPGRRRTQNFHATPRVP